MASVHMARWCALLCLAVGAEAAGDAKLWELGADVDANPITVFSMFTFTVILTIIIETVKHKTEHKTHDVHRKLALGAIYSELMMVGVVSFLLILAAELGITDLKIKKPGCTPAEVPTNATGSASGSAAASAAAASGSDDCYIGFDLLMFEFAHLVLFFMGITYGVFIQLAFWQRDRMVRSIEQLQMHTLSETVGYSYTVPSLLSIIGVCDQRGWARCLLTMRAAIVLQLRDQIKNVCRAEETKLESALAVMKGEAPPPMRATPEKALVCFDLSRFAHVAIAEVLVELLHVPPVVWVAIIAMSATNLIHTLGLSLPITVLIFAFLGPLLAISLLTRMAGQLQEVVKRAVGHPDICKYEFESAYGSRDPFVVDANLSHDGQMWSMGEEDPWETLDGCCDDDSMFNSLDPNDPGSLEIQLQIVVFACCFFVGQITMLSILIYDELGIGAVAACWILPIFPLVVLVPRAIVLYTLAHKTREARRTWLVEACEKMAGHHSDHGEHGHGHGEEHFDEKHLVEVEKKSQKTLAELKNFMTHREYDNEEGGESESEELSVQVGRAGDRSTRDSLGPPMPLPVYTDNNEHCVSPSSTMSEMNGGHSFPTTASVMSLPNRSYSKMDKPGDRRSRPLSRGALGRASQRRPVSYVYGSSREDPSKYLELEEVIDDHHHPYQPYEGSVGTDRRQSLQKDVVFV